MESGQRGISFRFQGADSPSAGARGSPARGGKGGSGVRHYSRLPVPGIGRADVRSLRSGRQARGKNQVLPALAFHPALSKRRDGRLLLHGEVPGKLAETWLGGLMERRTDAANPERNGGGKTAPTLPPVHLLPRRSRQPRSLPRPQIKMLIFIMRETYR